MMTVLAWVLVVVALIGTVLNVRRDRRCFYLWAWSNAGLAWVNAAGGQWAQVVLFGVYFGLALVGLWTWKVR